MGGPNNCCAIAGKFFGKIPTRTTRMALGYIEWPTRVKFYPSVIALSSPVRLVVSLDAEGHRFHAQDDIVGGAGAHHICSAKTE